MLSDFIILKLFYILLKYKSSSYWRWSWDNDPGFVSNGKDYFGFIREINAPYVIAEGVFIDNNTDMTIADTKEKQRKFGLSYAKGIACMLKHEDNLYSEVIPYDYRYAIKI